MRFLNRALAAVLSIALIVLGLLVVIEVVAQRVGADPVLVQWPTAYDWAGRTSWDSTAIKVASVALVLIGLLLLVAELKPARVRRFTVAGEPPGVDIAYTRKGLSAAVTSAAGGVDGIRDVSAIVTRRRVRVLGVAASTERSVAEPLAGPVDGAVRERIQQMQLDPAPRVAVSVKARKR